MNESAQRRHLGSELAALVTTSSETHGTVSRVDKMFRPWVSEDVVTTQLPHVLSLSIVQMIIDILPSGAECILSLINSVDVSFIKFIALDEILAVFEHSLYFRFILLYFIKKELKKKETC